MNPSVYDCDYTHSEAEFEEMQALLVNSYATSAAPCPTIVLSIACTSLCSPSRHIKDIGGSKSWKVRPIMNWAASNKESET